MLYKPFADLKLSVLGMGNMRLPTAGEGGPIDREKARAVIERAYACGINYFDTAYRYHGGESESFVGEVLRQYPRDTWYLVSKMPGHMMNFKDGRLGFQGYLAGEKIESIAQIFEEQLEKCGVDYFDFYLLHNVCESSWDFYTNETLDVVGYLLEQKKRGRIRHLGLSSHGRADTIDRFLTKYEGCFEFVQIQLNYMDWTLQGAAEKYAVVTAHGLPVIVMEPCRGGRLAALPEAAERLLKAARPADSTASWAFRFLTSLPNVQVVLSGMTTLEQLEENAALFSKDDPTTASENELLQKGRRHLSRHRALHRLPLLLRGLPAGAGNPEADRDVQRAARGRHEFTALQPRRHGAGGASSGLHWLRRLCAGMSAGDRYPRHNARFCIPPRKSVNEKNPGFL